MNQLKTDRTLKNYSKMKRRLLRDMAITARDFFKVDVFEAQGFIDGGVKRWPPRKKEKKKDRGRKILVKTGKGRRSIRSRVMSANTARVMAHAVYMGYHNRGDKPQPKRQFMGDSRELNKKLIERIDLFMSKL
jgi:phage gpG-like protein